MQNKNSRALIGKVVAFGLLCAIFVGLRWNNYDAPLIRDEGEYAYSAWLLREGRTPYVEAFLQKPPMIIYTYAFAQSFSDSFYAARILAAAFVAGAIALLGLVVRKEAGPGAAWATMFAAVPMLMLPYLEGFTANTEMFLLFSLMATIAAYVLGRQKNLMRYWFVAGALCAITLLYKYTVAPMLLFVIAVWIFETYLQGRNLKALAMRLGAAISGFAIVFALAIYPFFRKNALGAL